MRVLDLDLDFFLEDTCPLAPLGERPEPDGHTPWTQAQVREFLECRCGLSTQKPVPGRIFETHDGALRFWQERLADGTLQAPFCVTHVDAHSDLGIGFPGPGTVLNGVLPVEPEKRTRLEAYYRRKQLDEANYLLFALAFRWVDQLENVRNPRSKPDLPAELFVPGRPDCIRLSSFAATLLEGRNGAEPVISYHVYADGADYQASEPFDFATLAVSPRYAPAAADALVPVIGEYMQQI